MKFNVKVLIFCVCLFSAFNVYGAKKADFIVVVDQSKSIKKSLPNVKDFISKRIFNEIARPEDRVHILSFDGLFYKRDVLPGDADIFEVGYSLDAIHPVGAYTDLTNAVVNMNLYIKEKTDPKSKKIIFFLTDGLNEPPEYSKYQGSLRASFFSEARREQQEGGWVVFVTGIGEETDAPKLAEYINAEYVQMSDKPTLSEFDNKIAVKMESARKQNRMLLYALAASVVVVTGTGAFLSMKKMNMI